MAQKTWLQRSGDFALIAKRMYRWGHIETILELYFDKEKDEWQKVQSSDEDDSLSQAEARCYLRNACSGMAMDEDDSEEGEIYHSETTDKRTQSAHGKCILDKNLSLTAKLTKCFHCHAMEK